MTDSLNNFDLRPEDIEYNLRPVNLCDAKIIDKRANRRRRCPIMVEFTNVNVTSVDLARALEAGMNISKFRMAFSTRTEKVHMLSRMDKAAERCAIKKEVPVCPVATCCALKTWVKKIGIFKHDPTTVLQGSEVILTCDKAMIDKCTEHVIYLDYDYLAQTNNGQEITFSEGNIVLHCMNKVDDKSIKCKVVKGGNVNSLQTAYFRNTKNTTPFISKTDINILKFITQYQVDILYVYYARDGAMIQKIRRLISKAKFKPMIFSAICNQEGIDNFDEILKNTDGIVLCRGILQYELPARDIFRLSLLQKWIAGKCHQAGKPMFITSVFEHTVKFGDIFDSEISDVTNALMDGVTGFIIRNHNNINYTENAIHGLNDICCQVEPLTFDRKIFWRMMDEFPVPVNASEAAILSCVAAANQTNARVVVIPTVSGQTARTLLWLRPACIVITVCERLHAARMMYSCRNIVPIIYKGENNKKWQEIEEDRVQHAAEFAVAKQWMQYGDMYVSLQRSYEGHLFCDVVKVWTVTFTKKMLVECHYGSDEDNVINESFEAPKPKKRRRKKKKMIVQETIREEKVEEEEDEDEDRKGVHVTITTATPSKMARESEKELAEMEEEEEEKVEEDDED